MDKGRLVWVVADPISISGMEMKPIQQCKFLLSEITHKLRMPLVHLVGNDRGDYVEDNPTAFCLQKTDVYGTLILDGGGCGKICITCYLNEKANFFLFFPEDKGMNVDKILDTIAFILKPKMITVCDSKDDNRKSVIHYLRRKIRDGKVARQ